MAVVIAKKQNRNSGLCYYRTVLALLDFILPRVSTAPDNLRDGRVAADCVLLRRGSGESVPGFRCKRGIPRVSPIGGF